MSRPNKSVRRGKMAERRIAKVLSRCTGETFIRTPGSGSGHAWQILEGKKVRGDIYCKSDSEGFPFMVESKRIKRFRWDLLLIGRAWSYVRFRKWWNKVLLDAAADNKRPVLIISVDRQSYVAFSKVLDWMALEMKYQSASLVSIGGEVLIASSLEFFARSYINRGGSNATS